VDYYCCGALVLWARLCSGCHSARSPDMIRNSDPFQQAYGRLVTDGPICSAAEANPVRASITKQRRKVGRRLSNSAPSAASSASAWC
jgi:hypothetical protein